MNVMLEQTKLKSALLFVVNPTLEIIILGGGLLLKNNGELTVYCFDILIPAS
jgi:hypothetical protein